MEKIETIKLRRARIGKELWRYEIAPVGAVVKRDVPSYSREKTAAIISSASREAIEFIADAPALVDALIAQVELAHEAAAHFYHCRTCASDGDCCEEGQRLAVRIGLISE